jgi:hypothetical protein
LNIHGADKHFETQERLFETLLEGSSFILFVVTVVDFVRGYLPLI